MTVVAAALLRDGRVLAAQRSYPPEVAGCWELPGGKVQAGETDREALRREIAEELGAHVTVGDRVGPDLPTALVDGVLRVFACELAAGEPVAIEHQQVRWLSAAELDTVAWLDNDAPLLPYLRELLLPDSPA